MPSESTTGNVPRYGTVGNRGNEAGDDTVGQKRPSSLSLGPRKRPNLQTDPLIHHGRHFGRTVYAFVNMHALLVAGISADEDTPPETQQERRELRIYQMILKMVPGLEERLMESSEEELMSIANMLQKGTASARADDTKSLKGTILDWLVQPGGAPLDPPLSRNVKINRGFNHGRTGFLLCPAELDWNDDTVKQQLKNKEIVVGGSHWPIFVYQNEKWDADRPWKGLFRSHLLVLAYKHIFTSPSSVSDEPKATRCGNARIHGMSHVTRASIAYVATQVRFALSSTSVFSRTDMELDSETFYISVLEVLEDLEEQEEVRELLAWWNKKIFPSFSNTQRLVPTNSVLAKIKERRKAFKGADPVPSSSSQSEPSPAATASST